jgi:hypothetical protein
MICVKETGAPRGAPGPWTPPGSSGRVAANAENVKTREAATAAEITVSLVVMPLVMSVSFVL